MVWLQTLPSIPRSPHGTRHWLRLCTPEGWNIKSFTFFFGAQFRGFIVSLMKQVTCGSVLYCCWYWIWPSSWWIVLRSWNLWNSTWYEHQYQYLKPIYQYLKPPVSIFANLYSYLNSSVHIRILKSFPS